MATSVEKKNMDVEQAEGRKLKPISLVGASAGTGKTFCLTTEFTKLLLANEASLLSVGEIRPLQVIATSFTNKASDELLQRMQSHLIALGAYETAHLIRGSYIGTVNSISGRLVSEYALEGGLSPSIKVLDEHMQRKMFLACSEDAFASFSNRLSELAHALSFEDWRNDVSTIVSLARQNSISKPELMRVSEQSWSRLNQLLPECLPLDSEHELDAELRDAIALAIKFLERSDDETKLTQIALEFLRTTYSIIDNRRIIPWSSWARMSKLKVASKNQSELRQLKAAASRYSRHPRLRRDWCDMIESVISCACMCMDGYSAFKLDHALIDFADQELLAYSLLNSGVISNDLAERFKVLMVDEFQDTNPIQLAVFLKLAQSVEGSLWVGDEKQSIFGFRGADPQLMQEVCALLPAETGGIQYQLSKSFRSRPELVAFSNALFCTCMPPLGFKDDEVRISEVARHSLDGMEQPLNFWWLGGQTIEESLIAMSSGVMNILKEPARFMVQDKETSLLRPIVGSDIAVLCRSNDHRLKVAEQLSSIGIQVATERSGLLNTPECTLAIAALRFMTDPYDTLAAAILIRFSQSNNEWLSKWLQLGFAEFAGSIPILQNINQNRFRLMHLTPLETLELAIMGSGIIEIIKGLGDFRQRALNLDALRGIAREYEEGCLATGRGAIAAGLVSYLNNSSSDSRQPQNPGNSAVNVLTYHKAKGLEWPLVILYDLDRVRPGTAFGISIDQESRIDIKEPLRGRRLRYWPWPYGKHRQDLDLGQASSSVEARASSNKQLAESVRLMYVGVTRARDYLVFAARPTMDGTSWLGDLKDASGQRILSLPYESGLHDILPDLGEPHFAKMQILSPTLPEPTILNIAQSSYSTPQILPKMEQIPYRITPSSSAKQDDGIGDYYISERLFLGERIAYSGNDESTLLGDVLHGFLAADNHSQPISERMQSASELLQRYRLSSLKPFDLVHMSNRLTAALSKRFPGAQKHSEYPVYGFKGLQRVRGSIDLLLLTEAGYVVVDHKTYPGRMNTWEEKTLSHASQLFTYKKMVEDATAMPIIGCYIHLPILGQLFQISAKHQVSSSCCS
jgi:ATP-dependent helicase/nuclease subunit A